jgi:hypothetical protein
MSHFRSLLATGIATAVIAGGAIVLSPTAAASVSHPSAACPSHAHPTTPGGTAAWTVTCSGNHVYVNGWVKDTAPNDGRCAGVKAFFAEAFTNRVVCNGGTATFAWSSIGNWANVYLYVQ